MILIPTSKPSITTPPLFTFLGPDSHSQVKALNASGTQVASFTVNGHKGSFTVSRHNNFAPSDATLICTSHASSMSGAKTMSIHGHTATLKSENRFEVSTMNGPLEWRIAYDGDGARSWRDNVGNVVARGIKKDGKLEVFVPGDELVLDCLLAGWMALVLPMSPTSKGVIMGLKLFGSLMGAQ